MEQEVIVEKINRLEKWCDTHEDKHERDEKALDVKLDGLGKKIDRVILLILGWMATALIAVFVMLLNTAAGG